jgi:hypothetical protein
VIFGRFPSAIERMWLAVEDAWQRGLKWRILVWKGKGL